MYKYNVGLKTRLQKDLSEPKLHSDLVYNFRKLLANLIFLTI